MKRCPRCQQSKPNIEFGRRRDTNQLGAYCRSCESERVTEWRKNNQERQNATQRRWHRKHGRVPGDPFPPLITPMTRCYTEDDLRVALQQSDVFYAALDPLRFEIGDRAFLYAEKHQRDERWWLGEWARVENRRIAYEATKGES